jgi:phosphohistidine phosphatase
MTIYFLRHASAGQKKLSPKKDEKRSLDNEGVRQCTQMGRVLSALEVSVDAVITSPLKRATQTAALVANEIGYDGKLFVEAALRPEAKYEQFREMLRKYPRAEAVIVVGHNPNFSDFLGQTISGAGARAFVSLKKGAVAKVESEQKRLVLQWMLTPRVARASADSSSFQAAPTGLASNGSASAVTSNGASAGEKHKPVVKKNKQRQATASTTKSRPKTSRK